MASIRPSLFPNVPPFVQFLPVAGNVEFIVDPPEEMREMLWMVPSVPWHTISNCAELNGFTVQEVRTRIGCKRATAQVSKFCSALQRYFFRGSILQNFGAKT